MKVTAKRRAYNARYYRNHLEIWARSNARRKALRPIFTPKLNWSDRAAVAEYGRQRNAAYRAAHPTWTAEKCKAWRAKRRAVEAANLGRIGRSFLIA
jgi:hypothetical protein